jgi:hypothetical protein
VHDIYTELDLETRSFILFKGAWIRRRKDGSPQHSLLATKKASRDIISLSSIHALTFHFQTPPLASGAFNGLNPRSGVLICHKEIAVSRSWICRGWMWSRRWKRGVAPILNCSNPYYWILLEASSILLSWNKIAVMYLNRDVSWPQQHCPRTFQEQLQTYPCPFPITRSRALYPRLVQVVLRNVSSSWSRSFWWLSSQFLPSLDTLSKGTSGIYRPSSYLVFDIGGKFWMADSILRMVLEFVTIYSFSHLEINFRPWSPRESLQC